MDLLIEASIGLVDHIARKRVDLDAEPDDDDENGPM